MKDEESFFKSDQQYDDLTIDLQSVVNLDKLVSNTCLWTRVSGYLSQPKVCRTNETWFPEGSFKISLKGETTGHLLDGTPIKVKTLVDSGATKPILSKVFTSISNLQNKTKKNESSRW